MDMVKDQLKPALIEHLEGFITPERRERIDTVLSRRTRHITVVLENLYQPHNASAVVRSCECFGVQDLHVIENTHSFERTRGVSLGADKWLSMHHYKEGDFNTPECLEGLKSKGYTIAATTLRPGAIPLHELSLDKPVALAFGTEQHGLTEEAHALADAFVYLPMQGFTQSFNISVSCALTLYDLRTRLNESGLRWELSEGERIDLKLEWLQKTIRASEDIIQAWLSAQEA